MYPVLEINLTKIAENTRTITNWVAGLGLEVFGVTKVCGAIPQVAQAILSGGATGIADSRLQNIRRLREAQVSCEMLLLRVPALSEIDQVISYCDVSLNSEYVVLEKLSAAAQRQRKKHQVILMVDLGDLREGVLPEKLGELYQRAIKLPGITVSGIGTNLACYGGVIPTSDNMQKLATLASGLACEYPLVVSGGNSSALHMIKQGNWQGAWTKQINQLRIGESIFLGWDITDNTPLDGCHLDACLLHAEVIEVKRKPSVPFGEIGPDAFGNVPQYQDRGYHRRAILALGKQELGAGNLAPLDNRIEVLGASSDHLILDVENTNVRVGDVLSFRLDYGALLSCSTSDSVVKKLSK